MYILYMYIYLSNQEKTRRKRQSKETYMRRAPQYLEVCASK